MPLSRLLPVILAAALSCPAPALAQSTPQADYAVDVPLTLGTGALWLALYLRPGRQVPSAGVPQEDPAGLDALVPTTYSEERARISDVGLYGSLALGLGIAVQQGIQGQRLGDTVTLYAEAMAINGALTEVTKYAVRRPRPYTYTERTGEIDDDLSFYSGHASFTATASMITARSLDLSHDLTGGQRAGIYGGAALVSGSVAALRVAAGKHFISDVTVGVLMGSAVGWLIPELHRMDRRLGGATARRAAGRPAPQLLGVSVAWLPEAYAGEGDAPRNAPEPDATGARDPGAPVMMFRGMF